MALGGLACNMKDIEMGIRLLANSTSGIDAEEVVQQIYLKRSDSNVKDNSRQNIQRAFVDVTLFSFTFLNYPLMSFVVIAIRLHKQC